MRSTNYLVLAFLLAILASSCARKGGNSITAEKDSSKTEDSASLVIGYLPTLDALPLLISEEKGWLDSAGIDIRLRRFDSAMDLDTALIRHRVHGILTDLVRAVRLNNSDNEIKIVTSTDGRWNIITQRKKRIRKVQDLDERMIATARDEASDYLIEMILAKDGMDVARTNRPQINAIPLRETMLEKEQVDAAILPEPWTSRAVWRGDRNIASDSILGIHAGCMVFHKKALVNWNPDMIRLADIYNSASDYINSHSNEAKALISRRYEIEPEALDSLRLPRFRHTSKPSQKSLEDVTSWLLNHYSEQDFLGFRVLKPGYRPDNILDDRMIR